MSVPVELDHEIAGALGGSPVVLSSSLGTNRAMWEPQLAALSGRHRVISYDHRGHGASPVPPGPYAIDDLGSDVLALLDRLAIERTSWVGVSLGGMVGLWLAAFAPERIERLVVICSAAYAPPASAWVERAAAVRAAGTTATIADAVVARWFTPDFASSEPASVARARAMLVATPAEGYAGCCAVLERLDLRSALGTIGAPTLVISAAGDTALPPERSREIAAGIPGARLEPLPRGAHLASIEEATSVNGLIIDHLAALPSPGAADSGLAAGSGRRDG
jgi:3-oxoadipate enol-lactonase